MFAGHGIILGCVPVVWSNLRILAPIRFKCFCLLSLCLKRVGVPPGSFVSLNTGVLPGFRCDCMRSWPQTRVGVSSALLPSLRSGKSRVCDSSASNLVSYVQAIGLERAGAGEMTWGCPRCTFLNQGGVTNCRMCSYDYPQAVVDSGPEWSCPTCTFLNPFVESACEMCTTARPELDELQRIESGNEAPRSTGKFRPLRACQRSSVDMEEMSEDGGLNSGTPPTNDLESFLKPPDMSLRKRKAVGDEEGSKAAEMEGCTSKGRLGGGGGDVSNNLLGELHLQRMARVRSKASADIVKSRQQNLSGMVSSTSRDSPEIGAGPRSTSNSEAIVILSYNVWFREDLELHGRMTAIGNIIEQHQPHVICFQEVTANIYSIFQNSSWWNLYQCSLTPAFALTRSYFCLQLSRLQVCKFHRNPFSNSIMGRELCMADLDDGHGEQLVVATTHLESPCPAPPTWNQMFSKERVAQAREALNLMKDMPNVVFGGDMNWDDKLDGAPPLSKGWFDAWLQMHPDQPGLTYDTKANPMLTGNRLLQKRLDRLFCHLRDFKIESIEIVGNQAIPGVSYQKERKVKKEVQLITLPVLPSDHFGLLLKLQRIVP